MAGRGEWGKARPGATVRRRGKKSTKEASMPSAVFTAGVKSGTGGTGGSGRGRGRNRPNDDYTDPDWDPFA